MAKEKLKMAADVCSYVDEEKNQINLEICVPGVKKENIHLKMLTTASTCLRHGRTSITWPRRPSAAR